MRINIDVPSLVNFVTEKFVSDWIESAVTSRHLNVYNSSRSITHKQADENVIVLKGQNKKRHCKIILFTFIYFLFFTWMMWSSFLALVDMNYVIAIIVDNTI